MKHLAEQTEFNFEPPTGLLNRWRDEAYRLANKMGWYEKPRTLEEYLPTALVNMNGEISELWEAFRNGTLDAPCDKADKMTSIGIEPLTCLEEEVADWFIRAFDFAAHMKVDVDRAVWLKHTYNATRPHRHGGKRA